jgi:hypothetical protein
MLPHTTQETLQVLPIIQTLCVDVLREIFRICLPPFRYQQSTDFELDKPPYTLAKVCRHWRSVCLSTPLLWVDLPTIITNRWETVFVFPSGFSRLWRAKLTLSSPCDLRLYLHHYDEIPDATLFESLRSIQAAFPRVRMLDLCTNMQLLRAISQRAAQFERLRVLKIHLIEDLSTNPIPQLEFHSKITSLTLQSRKSPNVSRCLLKCVKTLWSGLIRFDGEYLPASSLREILSAAPLLAQLTIRNAQAASDSAESSSSPLIHIRLKMLHLLCKPPKGVEHPGLPLPIDLSGIRLPKLEDLFVQYPLPEASVFLSFLEHTQGSLRNLCIGGVFESASDQKEMYELCPRLESLTMAHANDESLKPLTLTLFSKPICLRLRRLTLPLFKLDSKSDYLTQTPSLYELTKLRVWGPGVMDVSRHFVLLESLTVVVAKASNFLQFQSLKEFSLSVPHFVSIP